jgi:hypothetical protein
MNIYLSSFHLLIVLCLSGTRIYFVFFLVALNNPVTHRAEGVKRKKVHLISVTSLHFNSVYQHFGYTILNTKLYWILRTSIGFGSPDGYISGTIRIWLTVLEFNKHVRVFKYVTN